MIGTIAAIAALAIPEATVQRTQVRLFVAAYDRTVTPFMTRQGAAYDAIGSGFYAGTEQAIRISERAQAALAICPRTAAAVKNLDVPTSLPSEEREIFASYLRAKGAVYDSRCSEMRSLIAYVDDPSKASNDAALRRAGATQSRLVKQGWTTLRPVFNRLRIRKPSTW